MECNSVCNHTSDLQNRMNAKRESDLLRKSSSSFETSHQAPIFRPRAISKEGPACRQMTSLITTAITLTALKLCISY